MKLKVCGMRDVENIAALIELKPDFIGFIFYDKSPRFVENSLNIESLGTIPFSVKKVGVFVNATVDYILQTTRKYGLNYAQLHGNETPDFCKNLRQKGVSIIKAFSVDGSFVFTQLNNYKPHVDFFLFDAKGDSHGGNGVAFDWGVLTQYDNQKPYFLAGGLDIQNIDLVHHITPKPYAIDVNSKFEVMPGLKDISKISDLLAKLKPEEGLN